MLQKGWRLHRWAKLLKLGSKKFIHLDKRLLSEAWKT